MTKLTIVQDRYEKETDVMDGEYIVATFYGGVNGESTHQQNAELFAKGFQEKAELLEVFEEMLEDYKLACDDLCGESEYVLELIEKAEKVLEKFK